MNVAQRLTVDELAAIARLVAVTPPPYVTMSDAVVESGTRSLVARGFFREASPEGELVVAAGALDAAVALCTSDRFAVLTRAGTGDANRAGRIVLTKDGGALLEESVYPGVIGVTPIDPAKLGAFLTAMFGLEDERLAAKPHPDGLSVSATLHADAAASDGAPVSAPGWMSPELSSVLVIDADESPRAVQWVVEGLEEKSLWLLEPEESDSIAHVPARQISPNNLQELLRAAVNWTDIREAPAL